MSYGQSDSTYYFKENGIPTIKEQATKRVQVQKVSSVKFHSQTSEKKDGLWIDSKSKKEFRVLNDSTFLSKMILGDKNSEVSYLIFRKIDTNKYFFRKLSKSGKLIATYSSSELIPAILQDTLVNYNTKGEIISKTVYQNNQVLGIQELRSGNEQFIENVFLEADQMPEFPGGEQALFTFIAKNLKYPPQARSNNQTGTIYAQFVVMETGELRDLRLKGSPHPLLKEEVAKLISSMPKWKPGNIEGQKVRVRFTLPLKFSNS